MKCLIDADTIAFACAASAEDSELWVACARADEMVQNILQTVEATSYELWLSGPKNFRYSIYPEYKANRLGAYRPKYERDVKDHLVREWSANWSDGCEADDMVGVRQTNDSIIAHIDKDINMIPGWHYNWPLIRKGKVIREGTKYFVSPEDADRWFYTQLLMGDRGTDNIPGVQGIGPKKAEKLIAKTPQEEWFNVVREAYSFDPAMKMNAQVLWIWRKENDIWQWPEDKEFDDPTISEEQRETTTADGS